MPSVPAASEVKESRLFETVRLIREWIEASFEPEQEARFNRAGGKLKARFDVDLGSEMCEQLRIYAKASFALSKLQFRLTEREQPGKPPRPCVEVQLSAAARQLYAEKHPEAVARRRALAALEDGNTSTAPADDANKALPNNAEPAKALTNGSKPAGDVRPGGQPAAAPDTGAPSGTKRPAEAGIEPAGKRGSTGAPPSSVWQAVPAREVPSGLDALRQVKDALDAGLQVSGALCALKAEKEAVAWLKGLASCSIGAVELRETLIGQAVNAWRKHQDPYISSLAVSLLRMWKAAWREAEADVKRRVPSSSSLALVKS